MKINYKISRKKCRGNSKVLSVLYPLSSIKPVFFFSSVVPDFLVSKSVLVQVLQRQRAAISIMNNIAEGFDSGSVGRFVFHLKVSRGSCAEVNSMLYLCEDFNLCDEYKRIELQNKIKHISSGCIKIINGYKRE